ncbi:hypothetical protein HMI56_004119, partial [Coelomomyces lativittatus]
MAPLQEFSHSSSFNSTFSEEEIDEFGRTRPKLKSSSTKSSNEHHLSSYLTTSDHPLDDPMDDDEKEEGEYI